MKKMLSMSAAALAAVLLVPGAVARDSNTTVHFAHGANTATLNGSLKGYDSANFLMAASAGQTMKIDFKPGNGSCYINVMAPGSNEAIFNGSAEGNSFAGTLSVGGTYKVQAYLMRNEARRGATCKFTLTVSITGGSHGGTNASAVSDDHMRGECKGSAAGMYGVRPMYITFDNDGYIFPASDGWALGGTVDKGAEGTKSFNCVFDKSRHLIEVQPLDSDGE